MTACKLVLYMALCCCIYGIENKLLNDGDELGMHGWWQFGDAGQSTHSKLIRLICFTYFNCSVFYSIDGPEQKKDNLVGVHCITSNRSWRPETVAID